MALPSYLAIRGERQGPIMGPAKFDQRQGLIRVLAAFHSVVAPRNPNTPNSNGTRVHKPFTIVKAMDCTTPQLFTMLVTHEPADLELRLYQAGPGGAPFNHLTATMRGAMITRLELKLPNVLDPRMKHLGLREEVSFIYKRIEWASTKPHVVAGDNWHNTT